MILVTDETFNAIQLTGSKRLRGRVWLEDLGKKKQFCFMPYQKSKRSTRILYQLPFGALVDTAKNVRLTLSAPKRVGWHRAAELLLSDAKESTDALHQMADKHDELLNSIQNEQI